MFGRDRLRRHKRPEPRAVAIVVAVLGVINTLAALILERKRDLALLRGFGMSAV